MSEVTEDKHLTDEELYEDALDDLSPATDPGRDVVADTTESGGSHSETGGEEEVRGVEEAPCEGRSERDRWDKVREDEEESREQATSEPHSHSHTEQAPNDDDDDDDDDDKGLYVDELALKDRDVGLSAEQLETLYEEAVKLKEEGNELFRRGEMVKAVELYTQGLLTCPLSQPAHRAVLYSNRAASLTKLGEDDKAISDCTKALELNPTYVKVLLRRAELYEKTDKLDEALADHQKLLELDPTLRNSLEACHRLPEEIKVRNEKMKEEMIDKLKDLGNMVLRPFGLSTNNFKMEQDPNTGSYSVQFQQNPTS